MIDAACAPPAAYRAGCLETVFSGASGRMDMPREVLSVLVPVYNEEKTIAAVLDQVLALGPMLKEIVVVDDGSRDGTARVVEGVARREPRVRFFRQPQNQGKTAAIRAALARATGEILIIQDADLEYDPAEIPQVIEPIVAGRADVVYGSRFLVRKATRVLYFYHYLANIGLTFFSNIFTNRNMSDIETCYKAFRAEVIKPLALGSKGFGMEVEITAMIAKTRARTYEVPISYYGRTYQEGKKIGLKDGLLAAWYVLFYNLIKPRLPAGRRYIRAVNEGLAAAALEFSYRQAEEQLRAARPAAFSALPAAALAATATSQLDIDCRAEGLDPVLFHWCWSEAVTSADALSSGPAEAPALENTAPALHLSGGFLDGAVTAASPAMTVS
jgi:glycosyltransferase involved in cell wall biosynthesis